MRHFPERALGPGWVKPWINSLACLLLLAPVAWSAPAPLPTPSAADEKHYQENFQQANDSLGKYHFEDSVKACETALRYKPQDYLVRAIMCLGYYEIAEALDINKHKDQKVKIYEKMAKIAEDGIRCAPERGECYFFRGLARARLSTTNGVLYSLFMAKGIEQDWLKAAKCHSEYVTPSGENLLASSYIALGSYYRLCPSFFLLSLIFGISGDLDKSVDYCHLAFLEDPRIEVVKEYGVSLITRGLKQNRPEDIEKGKAFLRSIPNLPKRLRTDTVDIAHSKMLLENIQLCPDYSRDQEQETSEKAFLEIQKQKTN